MNGERHSQPLPPTGPPTEPVRPSCATNFLKGFVIIGQFATAPNKEVAEEASEEAEQYFLDAVILARKAEDSDCANCLEGRNLNCPLKENLPETPTRLKSLRRMDPDIPARRFLKHLKEGGLTGHKPQDVLVAEELVRLGFTQPIEIRDDNNLDKDLRIVETVPDPRPGDGKEREMLNGRDNPRPPCAIRLSSYLKERYGAYRRWVKRNQNVPKDQRPKFTHPATLKIYTDAVLLSEEVSPSDCISCLEADKCPLLNGVDGDELYRASTTQVAIGDEKFKTRQRLINRLDGLARDEMQGPPDPVKVAELIDSQLLDLQH